jgi:hypothetical protein
MAQERRAGNGCISREGFLDPFQTNEMPVRVSSGFLVPMREGSGRASAGSGPNGYGKVKRHLLRGPNPPC